MVSSGSWDNNSTGENHEIIKSKHKLTIRWKKEETDKNNIEAADHHHDGSSVKWMSSKMRMMKKMIISDQTSGGSSNIASNNSKQKFEDQKQPLSPLGSSTTNNYSNQIRVCSDCNTTKTPLWRSGPRGPKVHIHLFKIKPIVCFDMRCSNLDVFFSNLQIEDSIQPISLSVCLVSR
jgi:hypothetical protein